MFNLPMYSYILLAYILVKSAPGLNMGSVFEIHMEEGGARQAPPAPEDL